MKQLQELENKYDEIRKEVGSWQDLCNAYLSELKKKDDEVENLISLLSWAFYSLSYLGNIICSYKHNLAFDEGLS